MAHVTFNNDGDVVAVFGCVQEHTIDIADEDPRLVAFQNKSVLTSLVIAVQAQLDAVATSMGYDSIYTACTYAEEPAVPKFQQEGRALRAWRSLVWEKCDQVRDAVAAGQRVMPTAEVLIAELPTLGL